MAHVFCLSQDQNKLEWWEMTIPGGNTPDKTNIVCENHFISCYGTMVIRRKVWPKNSPSVFDHLPSKIEY